MFGSGTYIYQMIQNVIRQCKFVKTCLCLKCLIKGVSGQHKCQTNFHVSTERIFIWRALMTGFCGEVRSSGLFYHNSLDLSILDCRASG